MKAMHDSTGATRRNAAARGLWLALASVTGWASNAAAQGPTPAASAPPAPAIAPAMAAIPAAAAGSAPSTQPVSTVISTHSPAATLIEERWRDSLEAFAAADKAHAPHAGGVLFVGSSSIRLWNGLETQFDSTDVIKRGFGGSRMADVARYVDQLVLPYKPRMVVVYAGDNDLAEGGKPDDVLASFKQFVERVQSQLPETRIAYVSIKPSPLRASLMPMILQTNSLIDHYARSVPNLDYVDVYSKMLDKEGKPRADLFLADSLHLNPAGYAIWKTEIAGHLAPVVLPHAAP